MDQALHLDKDLQSDSPSFDWPIRRRNNGTAQTPSHSSEQTPSPTETSTSSTSHMPCPVVGADMSILPGGRKSLSAIALRAFVLGAGAGLNLAITLTILFVPSRVLPHDYDPVLKRLWRPTFFMLALCVFHFLEYYVTAQYNTTFANISAFLLSTNGRAYNAAHTGAILECTLTSIFLPRLQDKVTGRMTMILGLLMVVVGQLTRTFAMANAGTNFNHTVQTRRNDGHVLVTNGIYSWLRHPSYFGFFWWGVGLQVVLGNILCGLAYAGILWGFFRSRIRKEEEFLVKFFGEEYEQYRNRTRVRIPFIR